MSCRYTCPSAPIKQGGLRRPVYGAEFRNRCILKNSDANLRTRGLDAHHRRCDGMLGILDDMWKLRDHARGVPAPIHREPVNPGGLRFTRFPPATKTPSNHPHLHGSTTRTPQLHGAMTSVNERSRPAPLPSANIVNNLMP